MSAIIQQTQTASGGGDGVITTTTRTVTVPVNTAAPQGMQETQEIKAHLSRA